MSESDYLLSDIDDDKKNKKTYDPRVFSSNRKLKVTALLEEQGIFGIWMPPRYMGEDQRKIS